MTDSDGSVLNAVERLVRDFIEEKLGPRATITKLKQEGDKISIEIVSPNHFSWTARALEEAASIAAETSNCQIYVDLLTFWPNT
jgi:hypothetical protein